MAPEPRGALSLQGLLEALVIAFEHLDVGQEMMGEKTGCARWKCV